MSNQEHPYAQVLRWIPGYVGVYSVSDSGNVFSTPREGTQGGQLVPKLSTRGYYQVTLSLNGRSKTALVHRLVASAFLPEESGRDQVNHIDGCKTNNFLSNLEWCNSSENCQHSYRTGLSKRKFGALSPSARLSDSEVLTCVQLSKAGRSCAEIARTLQVSPNTIQDIVRGKTWAHLTGIGLSFTTTEQS